jgi:hypothetical protein
VLAELSLTEQRYQAVLAGRLEADRGRRSPRGVSLELARGDHPLLGERAGLHTRLRDEALAQLQN